MILGNDRFESLQLQRRYLRGVVQSTVISLERRFLAKSRAR